MRLDVVTIFPDYLDPLREAGIENVALITESKKKAGEGGAD